MNDLGLKKKTEVDKLAERQQHFGLELTCAHEAYPGHHLQFILRIPIPENGGVFLMSTQFSTKAGRFGASKCASTSGSSSHPS